VTYVVFALELLAVLWLAALGVGWWRLRRVLHEVHRLLEDEDSTRSLRQ
jgi:hypothetical protein